MLLSSSLARSISITRRLLGHTHRTRGLAPGSVVHIGAERAHAVHLSVVQYDEGGIEERPLSGVDEAIALKDAPGTKWITIDGVHDPAIIEEIGKGYGIHSLVQEDVANTTQRPKCEPFDAYLYLVLPMLSFDAASQAIRAEQVSIIAGKGWLLCFLEDPGDVFEPVRLRLRAGRGRIRTAGSDYLAFTLIDVIVDGYFAVLESLGTLVEELEEDVLDDPDQETQQRILRLRRELVFMRRAAWPVRELVSQVERSESPLVDEATRPFFRDTYDHAVQVLDIVESMRDLVGGLMDLYMSSLSNRMNEVMKFLTIVGTIFIPLTFVAGIYGMNFDYMPELRLPYAYPLALLGMLAIALALLGYFKHRKWI